MRLGLSVALAAVLGVVFTLLVRFFARRLGFVAPPREDRWHTTSTASLGGVAIFAAFSLVYLTVAPTAPKAPALLWMGALVFVGGLVDDVVRIKPYAKLVLQLVAAGGLAASGLRLPWTHSDPVNDLITLFWLVAITNALNLLDNMDGLAGGIAAIGCLFLTINFILNGQQTEAFLPAVLGGAILGFLIFNVNPASIFMGDCGSMFLGFLLAGSALLSEYDRSRSLAAILFTPVLILLIPIFDTSFVTITRKLSRRPIAVGGRDHTSHRLVALGMSEQQAVLRFYALALLSGVLALAVRWLGMAIGLLLVPSFGLGVLFLGLYLEGVRVYAPGDVPAGGTVIRILADLTYKRRIFEVLLDVILVVLAYYGAYLLRWDGTLPGEQLAIFGRTLVLVIPIQIACLLLGGLYRGLWRYAGVDDAVTIGKSVLVAAAASGIVILALYHTTPHGPSRGVLVLDAILLLLFIGVSRLAFRLLRVLVVGGARGGATGQPMLIYGAGDGGELLAREILNNAGYGYAPIGFIDDDVRKAGKMLHGLPIYASKRLEELIRTYGIHEVVVSSQKVPESQLSDIRNLGVRLRRMRITIE
jgi:UDP-GlcNAc:undecaprenyl-phosphate GlcNAc-1-phosphate transferase